MAEDKIDKTKVKGVRLDEETIEKLDNIAQSDNITQGDLVKICVQLYEENKYSVNDDSIYKSEIREVRFLINRIMRIILNADEKAANMIAENTEKSTATIQTQFAMINELKEQIRKYSEKQEEYEERLNEANQTIENFNTLNSKNEELINELKGKNLALSDTITEFQIDKNELRELRSKDIKNETEINTLRMQIRVLEEKVQDMTRLSDEAKILDNKNNELEKTIDELSKDKKLSELDKNSELLQLERKLNNELNEERQNNNAKYQELLHQIEIKNEEIQRLKDEVRKGNKDK